MEQYRSHHFRFRTEQKYINRGFDVVIGLDEAGRGPLAGPVVAGAVIVTDYQAADAEFRFLLANVADSKKISPPRREIIYDILVRHKAVAWGIGSVSAKKIDRINILQASRLAMAKAVEKALLKIHPAKKIFCLIDGNFTIDVPLEQLSVIRGDAKIFSISAASIIAKVSRDRMLANLDKKYPGYGFIRHKGYPTKDHILMLNRFGPCPEHRRSFGPVLLCKKEITG